MKKEMGFAYCGLACCICSENENCEGCGNEGCKDKKECKNFNCCRQKGLKGCWECEEFPCSGGMLDKLRIRTFAKFIQEFGEEELLRCLERNEKAGMMYHYENSLTGDYDIPDTEEGIRQLIQNGR